MDNKIRLGIIAISCAAVDDVSAWCLLAFVVAVAQAKLVSALFTIVLALVYIAVMMGIVRPIVRRFVDRQELTGRLSQNATAVVLIGLVEGPQQWLFCGAIVLVACAGKFGGSAVAARLSGLSWRDSACVGVLMNTRGLMELIVLNLGLDLKVISPPLFAMLVIMALVTTLATTPALHLLTRGRSLDEPDLSASPSG